MLPALTRTLLLFMALTALSGYAQTLSQEFPITSPQELTQIRRQAESGDPRAMFQILKKSRLSNEEYRKWLTKSAELGYGPALFSLAKEEMPAMAPMGIKPKLVPGILSYKDRIKQAHERLLSWAQEGDVESMYMLGSKIRTFKKFKIAKIQDGIYWLRRASEAGHPEAPLELALTLFHDGESISAKREGFELIKKQALLGNCVSLHMLCNAYIYGEPKIGLTRDLTKAQDWIDLLAKYCGVDETDIYPISPRQTK
jgi:TPR repeat protein